mgnify:CR=1 FL=1
MIRLVRDQSRQILRSELISFCFDGAQYQAHRGESIAAALLRNGVLSLRAAPKDASPRGLFCCMGLCQECTVSVDGTTVESCRTIVADGMNVSSIGKNPE